MRKPAALVLVAALALTPLQSYSQSSTLQMLKPSPIGIALSVGQWLLKDRKKVYFIRVQGEGYSYEAAKQQAFATAVDRAVGAVVLSETEVRNNMVIRNEIIKYSAGFIDDFKVTKEETAGNIYRLELDVWVSDSRIADRLLAGSRQEGRIDGNRHAAQLESLQQHFSSGDRQLQAVLRDFPRRSFVTKAGRSNLQVRPDRTALLTVNFMVYWDAKYLDALSESLQNLNPKMPACGVHSSGAIIPLESNKIMVRIKKDPTGWGFGNNNCYHYNDRSWYNQVERTLGQRLLLLGKFYTQDKTLLQSGCFDVDLSGMNAVGFNLIDIKGNEFWEGTVGIPVSANTVKFFNSVEFEVVTDRNLCNARSL